MVDALCGFHVHDEVLGVGAFGRVVAATCESSPAPPLALKVIDKAHPGLQDAKALHRARAESRALRRLAHRNIVKCYGQCETDRTLFVVLSREDGAPLADVISSQGAMDETHAAPVILQLARALRHCHERKVSHRDVKLDNVLYDAASGKAVLIDFGFALIQKLAGVGGRLDVRCGSLEYNAPEVLDASSKGYHGPAADAWALGVCSYVLLCAAFPFGKSQSKLARGAYDQGLLSRVSAGARDLVAAFLVVDPNSQVKVNRLSPSRACSHSWLSTEHVVLAADTATNGGVPPSSQQAEARAEAAAHEEATRATIEEAVREAQAAVSLTAVVPTMPPSTDET